MYPGRVPGPTPHRRFFLSLLPSRPTLPGPVDQATQRLRDADWRRYSTHLQSRPEEAELAAIRLLLSLCREYKFRLHIVHLSASSALAELCAARAEGLPVSVETCPHYLHFCAEEIPDGATLCKCAPPIRPRENRERLWQGLKDGIIDLVATDHSPCPPAMKQLDEGSFKTAWGGISSLSLALAVIWTEASRRGFTLIDLTRWMCEQPARLAHFTERIRCGPPGAATESPARLPMSWRPSGDCGVTTRIA